MGFLDDLDLPEANHEPLDKNPSYFNGNVQDANLLPSPPREYDNLSNVPEPTVPNGSFNRSPNYYNGNPHMFSVRAQKMINSREGFNNIKPYLFSGPYSTDSYSKSGSNALKTIGGVGAAAAGLYGLYKLYNYFKNRKAAVKPANTKTTLQKRNEILNKNQKRNEILNKNKKTKTFRRK